MRPHPRRPAVDERRAPPHVHLSTPARGVQVPLAFPTENRFSVAVFCGCAGRFTARETVVAGPGSLLLLQDVFPLCRGDLRHPGSRLSARGPERKTLMRRRRCHLRSGGFPRRRSVEHGRVADTGAEYEATVLGAKQYSTGSATLSLFFYFLRRGVDAGDAGMPPSTPLPPVPPCGTRYERGRVSRSTASSLKMCITVAWAKLPP
jgi:hypothetical protein